jgi:hypothetical protein
MEIWCFANKITEKDLEDALRHDDKVEQEAIKSLRGEKNTFPQEIERWKVEHVKREVDDVRV